MQPIPFEIIYRWCWSSLKDKAKPEPVLLYSLEGERFGPNRTTRLPLSGQQVCHDHKYDGQDNKYDKPEKSYKPLTYILKISF